MKKFLLFFQVFILLYTNTSLFPQHKIHTGTGEKSSEMMVDDFYPLNVQYGTGYFDGSEKYDGDIDLTYPNVGWAVFDISSIPSGSVIQSITFYCYINSSNWPHWSATPMGTVNPIMDPGVDIYNQIITGYGQSMAYVYVAEYSNFNLGWHNYDMGKDAVPDLQDAVNSSLGWFSMGFIAWDFNPAFYLILDGHTSPNPFYIEVTYQPVPVELTSFRADVQRNEITLSWQTATETNNRGFYVERRVLYPPTAVNNWEEIGFKDGNGTTTEPKSYSYTDGNVSQGEYFYRLKQFDFDGSFVYSKEIQVSVKPPAEFSLEQNYPNPFNPSTKIGFSLPVDSRVTFKVYNVLGKEVARLVDGNLAKGTHFAYFNTTDVASGIYIYQLHASGIDGREFNAVKKMLLEK